MKRITWAAAIGLLFLAAGCNPSSTEVKDEGLRFSLNSLNERYFEYEPLDLRLVVTNRSDEAHPLRLSDRGFIVAHKIQDNDEAMWRSMPVMQDVSPQDVHPGEVVDINLSDRMGQVCLTRPGTWVVRYKYLSSSKRTPGFMTEELVVECVSQPLNIGSNTPPAAAAALRQMLEVYPARDFASRRPSWTAMSYSQPMRQLLQMGDQAIPVLMANIDHHRLRPQVIQLLGDLKARQAVPKLISMLQMNDGLSDSLILSALTNITGVQGGFGYYTKWSDPAVQKEAMAAFRSWWNEKKGSRS